MAITQRQVGAAVGGASLGLGGSEIIRHAVERDLIDPALGWAIVGSGAAGSLGLVGADLLNVISLPPDIPPLLVGASGGSTVWYALRSVGTAPKLTIDVPDEINLAGSASSTIAVAVVGIALGTAISLVTPGFNSKRAGLPI